MLHLIVFWKYKYFSIIGQNNTHNTARLNFAASSEVKQLLLLTTLMVDDIESAAHTVNYLKPVF